MNEAVDNWLAEVLQRIPHGRVSVFGDFCLDAYWLLASDESELSLETGLPVRGVQRQQYSLGGAGNVVANLADLGVTHLRAVGLMGDDLFGRELVRHLDQYHTNTEGLLACQDDWQTFVFAKPHLGGQEQNRLDFGGFNCLSAASIERLAHELKRAAQASDVVILNQQILPGLSTEAMIQAINRVIADHPACTFMVDSRHCGGLYKGVILKVNSHEATRLCGQERPLEERIGIDESAAFSRQLQAISGRSVFVTCGADGIVVADGQGHHSVPGIQVIERTDPVGAGDTVVAALAAALAVGTPDATAARLANIAASVTVRKIQTTGTASPEEILAIGPKPDYLYHPELAEDPRQARLIEDTDIEVVREWPQGLSIKHAIFDHDGTISTLREGWEGIMEPMMVRAILGQRYDDADETLYHRVVDRVVAFIDKTTGIQTLTQMGGLVELVRELGCVPEDQILDMHGYKAVYNDALLKRVHRRVTQLNRGELVREDFHIKNARRLLERLHAQGITLYLASGTDEEDVKSEAQALGYADLFEGRIFGAVGDVKIEAKRMVLDRLISEHQLRGTEFVTFGDGPVEMQETRKRGGIAVGVASDERRRFGLNPAKRPRLIRAGADVIVPDFSQLDALLGLLRVGGPS